MTHAIVEIPAPDHRLLSDPLTVSAALGPIPLSLALDALANQPELMAPAKLAISARRGGLVLAEVPRQGDARRCEVRVRAALDTALAWLTRAADVGDVSDAGLGARIDEALETLGWSWEPRARGSYLVRPDVAGSATRITVDCGACVRVARAPLALRVPGPSVARALRLFALEANARLRLARLSVAVARADLARVVWDAVLLPEPPLDRGLQEAVEALDVAHAETAGALRALATSAVAEAYLQSWSWATTAAMRDDASIQQPPASPPAIAKEETVCTTL